MELQKLLLTKEELPIIHETCFEIPVHPKLLDPNLKIDKGIAKKIFSQVAKEWVLDLREHAKGEKNPEIKKWYEESFLKEKRLKKEGNDQYFGGWKDHVGFMENGLVRDFMIGINAGGSLYFDIEDFNCQSSIPSKHIKFSDEKVKEFEFKKVGKYSRAIVYAHHNADYFPGALFLRNWAIKYMNEVFKQIFS